MVGLSSKKVWRNGEIIGWEDSTVHLSAHALHYGTAWFEGIRCYKTQRGSEVFRLEAHIDRLFNSCKLYRTELPFSKKEFCQAILETIRANELHHCYIRPLIFRGVGSLGVNPLDIPVECVIMVWEWGSYLGEKAVESGVDVCVSSWARPAPNSFPSMAKVAGNYVNSALIKMEAVLDGFSEGIALDSQGLVSEGSGENIVLVMNNQLHTPPFASSILPGITRDTVMTLASERGYAISEHPIPREMLYFADEVFLTGTAAEITPIRSIDHIPIGQGKRGPVTMQIQQDFFDYTQGKVEDRHQWMVQVYDKGRV